jgi:translation initiation factor IF-2
VLEDAIVTAAEMEGLWADPSGPAEGYVLEAKTVKGQGAVTTVLIKRGTLKGGDIIIAGTSICKVRVMRAADGSIVKSAGPSQAVELIGWRSMPDVGDTLLAAPDEKRAREAVECVPYFLLLSPFMFCCLPCLRARASI